MWLIRIEQRRAIRSIDLRKDGTRPCQQILDIDLVDGRRAHIEGSPVLIRWLTKAMVLRRIDLDRMRLSCRLIRLKGIATGRRRRRRRRAWWGDWLIHDLLELGLAE